MKNYKFIFTIFIAASVFFMTSCLDHLDRFPENETTSQEVFSTFEGFKGALAKVYAAYTLTGNRGPTGRPDVVGLDEGGNADFLRSWFNHQELPTDAAHCRWNDPGIPQLNNINFSSSPASAQFSIGLYAKCLLQIMYANEFLRNSADVSGRGFSEAQITEIGFFRAEARFLRAFAYWVLMDVFGNPPFVTERTPLSVLPQQIQRADLFIYIEEELLDLVSNNLLKSARTNEYGRACIAAANALLARLYLNAQVYTGTARWNDAVIHAERVIAAGFSLKDNYEHLFLADNHLDNNEFILTINYDGRYTRTHGGTTFLINCTSNGAYQSTFNNVLIHWGITRNANWSGYRVRQQFAEKFELNDRRRLFVGNNISLGDDPTIFENGLAVFKYRNIKRGSTVGNVIFGNDPTGQFSDVDFPLFRLPEMYLIYAEAVARGANNGTMAQAVTYFNRIRERAFGDASQNVTTLTAQDVLDERARELYWEGHRRTDLIRFNQFTTADYLWEWKGGVREGRAVSNHFNLFPIPDSDINANPNLRQNPGY